MKCVWGQMPDDRKATYYAAPMREAQKRFAELFSWDDMRKAAAPCGADPRGLTGIDARRFVDAGVQAHAEHWLMTHAGVRPEALAKAWEALDPTVKAALAADWAAKRPVADAHVEAFARGLGPLRLDETADQELRFWLLARTAEAG
jgi:hypothetical protein